MNKRKYPYEIDMCPQLKVHIGDKQVANGVMGPLKMSKIYEKTKRLLFEGAKLSFTTLVEPVIVENMPRDNKSYRQLQLTFDGKLSVPNTSITNSKICNSTLHKCNKKKD